MGWGGSEVARLYSDNAVCSMRSSAVAVSEADSRRAGPGWHCRVVCAEAVQEQSACQLGFLQFALVAIPSHHPGVNIEE